MEQFKDLGLPVECCRSLKRMKFTTKTLMGVRRDMLERMFPESMIGFRIRVQLVLDGKVAPQPSKKSKSFTQQLVEIGLTYTAAKLLADKCVDSVSFWHLTYDQLEKIFCKGQYLGLITDCHSLINSQRQLSASPTSSDVGNFATGLPQLQRLSSVEYTDHLDWAETLHRRMPYHVTIRFLKSIAEVGLVSLDVEVCQQFAGFINDEQLTYFQLHGEVVDEITTFDRAIAQWCDKKKLFAMLTAFSIGPVGPSGKSLDANGHVNLLVFRCEKGKFSVYIFEPTNTAISRMYRYGPESLRNSLKGYCHKFYYRFGQADKETSVTCLRDCAIALVNFLNNPQGHLNGHALLRP